jgi:capsular exopolysaccharide synthesis family protein
MQEQELHIRDYLRVLYRRKYPALAVFVVVVAVAVVRALLAPPVYRAMTRILIEKTEVQNLALANPLYSSWDPDFYKTQVQIIRSSATAEKAVKILAAEERFRQQYGAGKKAPPPASTALARTIRDGLSVIPEKDSKIVTITYVSSEPELAALIVNAVVRAYMEQLFEMKMSYSRYAIQWMTEKAREEGKRLNQAEQNLQSFMKANDLVTMENRVTVVPERLSEIGLELTRAETRRRELEAVYERLRAVADDPAQAETIPQVQEDASFQSVKGQLIKAEQRVFDLSKKYGQKHPTMMAAREEVELLQKKKAEEVRRVVASVRNEYELAQGREADLRGRLSSGRTEALSYNEKLVKHEELKRAVETNRQFYDTLMARAKEESMTQQLQGVQVFTLEPAEVPVEPDGPRKVRNMLLGLVVGLVGAVGMAFFTEYLDNTVRSPEDLELKTGATVLGVIPMVRSRGKSIEKAVLKEPRQPAAESYRALRTSILLSSDEGPPKSILVTSTAPEEGKTATAVNLAVATAQSGYTVILVDADMRKPRIDKVFDLPNDFGLSSCLEADDVELVPVEVGVKNLRVVPSGPPPPNPSELLGSKRMDQLVRQLKDRSDIVIFDSPPFLTVTDSLVLSKKVNAVIFVTRAERSTYDGVRRGIKALSDLEVKPLGLVLNAYDERRIGSYYYYYEGYGDDEGKRGRRRKANA